MLINIIRTLVIIAGPVIGYTQIYNDHRGILVGVVAALAIIAVEMTIEKLALDALIFAAIGAIIGLVGALLINRIIPEFGYETITNITQKGSLLLYIVLAYLGAVIFVRKRSEIEVLDRDLFAKGTKRAGSLHLVDTSVLIDGRLVDVAETRFISGALAVPRFVLEELQHLADASDNLKRARGRRGLEMLERLQKNPELPLKVLDKDYKDIQEVDSKLVALAKEMNAKILTTDFNLNKVASLQGVTVLNINDLTNALKPVVLPGETMSIFILKDGKERDQGVAYLDDGTMVVVEDGRRAIGQRTGVIVTSILQTSAGRMIFAKLPRVGGNHAPTTHAPAETGAEPPAHPDL